MKPLDREKKGTIPSGTIEDGGKEKDGSFSPDRLERIFTPQVKICGLKRVEEAQSCAQMGAHAIGCVFFPPSPRHVTEEEARDIFRALPASICSVGVFVNEGFSGIMRKVETCGLKAVQLHGQESAELVQKLIREGVTVIKAVFANGIPSIGAAESYAASAYLVECAGGSLPGGNAMKWDWSAGMELSLRHPLILAGGLNAGNVSFAINVATPDAVDVSSGVEKEPGRKDMDKVRAFIEAVSRSGCSRILRRIFE